MENRCERRENLQRDRSVVVDIHILGHPDPVLPLNMAKYDERSTAAAVEIQNVTEIALTEQR